VRDLVNHVVAEEFWTAPLLRGKTIREVGSQFDGDVLGEDPLSTARMGADEAVAIVDAIVPGGGRVQLSYGEEDMGIRPPTVRRPPDPRMGPRRSNRRGHLHEP
jgi:hypothetical protein